MMNNTLNWDHLLVGFLKKPSVELINFSRIWRQFCIASVVGISKTLVVIIN